MSNIIIKLKEHREDYATEENQPYKLLVFVYLICSGFNERQVKTLKGKSLGFLAPLTLSDALVKFFGTGENELSQGDVVKKVWGYIKQNDLQDPSDKKTVICDEKLKELFEVDSFTGFHVSKPVTAPFVKGIEQ